MSGNHRQINVCRSKHSYLFVNCNDHFKFWMRDFFGFQNCKCISYSNAIVPTQRSSSCFHKIAIYKNIQTIFHKVNITTIFLFTDHIHMSLNNNCIGISISFCCLFYNDHIIQFILIIFQLMFLCKRNQIITDLLCISGSMWNLCKFFKVIKNTFWI